MKPYLTFRKWVDRDLSRGPRVTLGSDGKSTLNADWIDRPGLSYLLAVLPLLIVSILEGFPVGGPSRLGILIALPFTGLIIAFVAWRQIRLLKARAIKSGRYYERKARFALPPEYHNSEDGILAKRRSSNEA